MTISRVKEIIENRFQIMMTKKYELSNLMAQRR
jgi:hypothetical protein